jgi:Lipase (class 3)
MEHVKRLYDYYPGYKLYITGHSLGGALATLFALEVAALRDSSIVKPVTCISIASPKVGNMSFRRAFQALEKQHQIRSLRIANDKDIVTLLPDRGSLSCVYIMCCQANLFRHVGVELKLYANGRYKLTRPSDNSNYVNMFLKDWVIQVKNTAYIILTFPFVCCKEDFLRYHGCIEYLERLKKNSSALQNIYLSSNNEAMEVSE